LQGNAADTVLSVNDLDDFARFATALDTAAHGSPVKRVAILGAGLIGCEFANDLLHRDVQATVVDLADRALSRLLPPESSERLQAKLEAQGAQFKFGVSVNSVDKSEGEHPLRLSLSDGSALDVDLVLSAIGLKPRTDMAAAAGVQVARGIAVNRELATNVPHVYAMGDCAEVDGQLLPYVLPLMGQARALAATLSGKPTAVSYPAMPVVVKTPAWPTVVCPPSPGSQGEWVITQDDEQIDARFMAGEQLLGFALQGKAVSQRQALAALVPPVLA